MTSRDFCYWLQGFFEITACKGGGYEVTDEQIQMIQKHLSMVFIHEIDPSMGSKEHQQELSKIHNPDLFELGKKHGFQVTDGKFGSSPGEGYKLSTLHGWYKESEGIPKC